jgi:hypothetical protein
LPQQFGDIPDVLGLTRQPNVFSTSFPQPGAAAMNFSTSLPGSREEARRKAIRTQAGGSKTMDTIGMNLTVAPWGGSGYDYQNELLKGQPLFSIVTEKSIRGFAPVLNIRQLNSLFRDGYYTAMEFWQDRQKIIADGVITEEQYTTLRKTPTERWGDLDFLAAILRDKNLLEYHSIRYLYEDGCREVFNFIGFMRNQGNQIEDLVQINVSHKGFVDSVENVFGNDLMEGHSFGFIFKRVSSSGPFALVPWYGFELPSIASQEYIDVNGFTSFGMTLYCGNVDRWVAEHEIDPLLLAESTGLVSQTSGRYALTPEPGCMRYHLRSRPGYRVPFLL